MQMPFNLFTEEDEDKQTKIACIAFAALIKAFGNPIEISDAEIDALPDTFRLSFVDIEGGRQFFITEDETE